VVVPIEILKMVDPYCLTACEDSIDVLLGSSVKDRAKTFLVVCEPRSAC
jgi:hypothetical protein